METEAKPGLVQCLGHHYQGLIITFLPLIFVTAMMICDMKSARVGYVIIGMLICYLFDIYPYPITAMLPVIAMPLMNILPSDKVCSLYFKETLVTFIVTIVVNLTMEYSKLHTRWALNIVKCVGCCIRRLHVFMIFSTVLVSFLIPNASAVTFMYPITKAVLDCLHSQGLIKLYDEEDNPEDKKPSKLAICFYMSVAYAANMGGSAILMASPTNIEAMNAYDMKFPDATDKIDSVHYLGYAMPTAIVYIILMGLILEITHMGLFRKASPEAMACEVSPEACLTAERAVADKQIEMGSMTLPECITTTLVLFMIIAMFTRNPGFITGWTDFIYGKELANASVCALCAYFVFGFPANLNFFKCWDASSSEVTPGLLTWRFVHVNLPWSLIFVNGCGAPLAEACRLSGLEDKIGDMLAMLKNCPAILTVFIVIVFSVLCTNITTNSQVVRVISPGILKLAVESKHHPLCLLLPSCLAGSIAFLIPPSTPCNSYMTCRENIKLKEMFFAGIGPTIAAILTIFIFSTFIGKVVYGNLDYPAWAEGAKATYFN